MKKWMWMMILVCGLFLGGISVGQAAEYTLGPGDVLNINVWGLDELYIKEIAIRADGKIGFPMIGEVDTKGLSAGGLAENIAEKLRKYIIDPKVTVNIAKFRTTRVYVLGEVNKPGSHEIEKECNVLSALGAAGGYTQYAAKKKLFLIRKDQKGEPQKINLLALMEKGDVSQNVALNEGDVLYLTSNNKINLNLVLSYTLNRSGETGINNY